MSTLELLRLENKGKREPWVPRWAVVETISGESLSVGRFVYKATAVRAIRGASKSADRLLRAFLYGADDARSRAKVVLKRYFSAYQASEGFEPKGRYIYRYERKSTK